MLRLTPNQRMAGFLQSQTTNDQDLIFPLSIWLETQYRELSKCDPTQWPSLLSANEQRLLWEKQIAGSEWGETLLRTSNVARLAADAWNDIHHWALLDQELKEAPATEELSAYLNWSTEYQALCIQRHWIDFAGAIDLLKEAILDNKMILPSKIEWVGFDEFSPQMKGLIEALNKRQVQMQFSSLLSPFDEKRAILRIAAEHIDAENRLMIQMAKKWLDNHPAASIALVVPDLEMKREELVRLCTELLLPNSFNIAAPVSLGKYPLIKAAVLALSFGVGEINLEAFSQFLRLPFFAGYLSEMCQRAMIDIRLREWGQEAFSWRALLSKLDYEGNRDPGLMAKTLLTSLKTADEYRSQLTGKRSAKSWCFLMNQWLEAMGWPGDRTLNSHEYQIHQQWKTLLSQYAQMDRVLGDHGYLEGLGFLTRLAVDTPFLPQSPNAPIQVLGVLEAAGIPFDYLWISGMHRDAWPSDPNPNPFIPISLQRAKDMPRCSAARELRVAERLTEQLSLGAKEVIFSFSKTVDEQLRAVSPLIAHFPEVSQDYLGMIPPSYLKAVSKMITLKNFGDLNERAPKIEASSRSLGGTRLLKLQAACPFRAFAEIRLNAKPLPTVHSGLNPAERGEIVHQVLLAFWNKVEDQTALIQLSEAELDRTIEEAMDLVFTTWIERRPRILTAHYSLLEKKRIHRLMRNFIALETTRPFFKVVAKEIEKNVLLGPLQIKIRIDRIDRLENDEDVLLDYKTGQTAISDWFGERPRDPQLPLYCVTHDSNPAGVAFGSLKPEGAEFQGLSKFEACLPGVKTLDKTKRFGSESTWEEQRTVWETTLTSLAKDFSDGVANVDPRDGNATCRLCSLKSLCRV